MTFLETIFNERQSGKQQCDRDTATAKRKMHYYIDCGNNIQDSDQMYEALQQATALSGFSANVLDIKERKRYIKLTQIHHVKYLSGDENKPQYQVWQYSGIGSGKKFSVFRKPAAPNYNENKSFFNVGDTFWFVKSATSDENTADIHTDL